MGRKAGTPGKCLVCGDNACGINYNVASCMSCKTFFRRNALKQKEAICQFSDCCTLDRITRKFCTKCRLKKCFEVGMNKEMIKTEDEKRKLEEKIRFNKIKRLEDPKKLKTKSKTLSPVLTSTVTTNLAPSTSKTLSTETTLVAEESMELPGSLKPNKEPEINIDEMFDSDEISSRLDEICPYIKDMSPVELSDIEVIPLDSLERFDKCPTIGKEKEFESHLLEEKIKRSKPKTNILSIDRISLISNERTLNLKMYEQSRLQEIYRAALAFPDESSWQIVGQVDNVSQLVNLATANIKHVVQFCKNMREFNCLTNVQQEIALKGFVPEINLVKVAFLYNTQTNGWIALENLECENRALFVKMDFFQNYFEKERCHFFSNFINDLNREMENDPAIRDLILAQSISKHRPNMGHKIEFLRYHNAVFHYLLRRYLEHKYLNTSRATQKYISLMNTLAKMEKIANEAREFFERAHITTHAAPVLREIFNLRQTSHK